MIYDIWEWNVILYSRLRDQSFFRSGIRKDQTQRFLSLKTDRNFFGNNPAIQTLILFTNVNSFHELNFLPSKLKEIQTLFLLKRHFNLIASFIESFIEYYDGLTTTLKNMKYESHLKWITFLPLIFLKSYTLSSSILNLQYHIINFNKKIQLYQIKLFVPIIYLYRRHQ